jgi:hypothetical protein
VYIELTILALYSHSRQFIPPNSTMYSLKSISIIVLGFVLASQAFPLSTNGAPSLAVRIAAEDATDGTAESAYFKARGEESTEESAYFKRGEKSTEESAYFKRGEESTEESAYFKRGEESTEESAYFKRGEASTEESAYFKRGEDSTDGTEESAYFKI